MSKIVISLGGNALGNSPYEQLELVKKAVKPIVDLVEQGHDVIVSHGNGPQVGSINKAFSISSKHSQNVPSMPFPECGAMSQGYIGYHLQNCIGEELRRRKISKKAASIITQVLVNSDDPAFKNPTKPIGSFFSEEEAMKLMEDTKDIYIEDSGRGYRKVVPSPNPIKVIERDVIKTLVEAGVIVISVGGGGIPVIQKEDSLVGVDAVIDKDLASECLAEELDADYLFVLTAVDKIAINFNKPNQRDLDKMSLEEAELWIKEGQFPPGSMLPKVESAIKFVKSKPGRKAIVSSLEKANEAILGNSGTIIYE